MQNPDRIVNSFNELVPGYSSADNARAARTAYCGGGTPMEFNTIANCDGLAMGHEV